MSDAMTYSLACLTADEQTIIQQHCVDGYTQAEIAQSMGISQPTAHRIITRAKAKLRKTYEAVNA